MLPAKGSQLGWVFPRLLTEVGERGEGGWGGGKKTSLLKIRYLSLTKLGTVIP